MAKYDQLKNCRLFIDESGDHVLKDEATLQKEGHRYLSVTGCVFKPEDYSSFHQNLEDLKKDHFAFNPNKPVILHRDDIVGKRKSFWVLREDARRDRFDNDLCNLITETDYVVIGIIIDKLALKHKYIRPEHPYHIAMNYLMQRYCYILESWGCTGDIMAESRGRRENMDLSAAFSKICNEGDIHHSGPEFYQKHLSSKEIKLKDKLENIAGLQIADILAHPLCKYALVQENRTKPTAYEMKIFKILESKFNQNIYTGEIEGYGYVLFPK